MTWKQFCSWFKTAKPTGGTDASFRGEEVSGSAKRAGKKPFTWFGLTWRWLIVFLPVTCLACELHIQVITETHDHVTGNVNATSNSITAGVEANGPQ
jgi:hypothetical protein